MFWRRLEVRPYCPWGFTGWEPRRKDNRNTIRRLIVSVTVHRIWRVDIGRSHWYKCHDDAQQIWFEYMCKYLLFDLIKIGKANYTFQGLKEGYFTTNMANESIIVFSSYQKLRWRGVWPSVSGVGPEIYWSRVRFLQRRSCTCKSLWPAWKPNLLCPPSSNGYQVERIWHCVNGYNCRKLRCILPRKMSVKEWVLIPRGNYNNIKSSESAGISGLQIFTFTFTFIKQHSADPYTMSLFYQHYTGYKTLIIWILLIAS